MKGKLGALLGVALVALVVLHACVDSGPGSDFDRDGVKDQLEDLNDDFIFDPGESDYVSPDTDTDGLCDGQPEDLLTTCTGCEDCNDNGFFEPCLGETDPLNNDTDNDGVPDASDPSPLDGFDCSAGSPQLPYGASLNGKPFPLRPTPTASPAPFPTSTPGATPTPFSFIPTPTPG